MLLRTQIIFALLCASFFISNESYSKSIRKVEADEQKVVAINTAVGYSTIIEFTSRPISAVLGDQDAFKLEYVGNSITLKPLLPHARSNLFIFTEYDRFNCTLTAVNPANVDYIVRITAPHKSSDLQNNDGTTQVEPSRNTRPIISKINRQIQYAGFSLMVASISKPKTINNPRGLNLVEIEITTKSRRYSFQPASIGIRQGSQFLNIESIYLSSLALVPGDRPVHGTIAILNQDLRNSSAPLEVIFAVPSLSRKEKVHRMNIFAKPSPKKIGMEGGLSYGKTAH